MYDLWRRMLSPRDAQSIPSSNHTSTKNHAIRNTCRNCYYSSDYKLEHNHTATTPCMTLAYTGTTVMSALGRTMYNSCVPPTRSYTARVVSKWLPHVLNVYMPLSGASKASQLSGASLPMLLFAPDVLPNTSMSQSRSPPNVGTSGGNGALHRTCEHTSAIGISHVINYHAHYYSTHQQITCDKLTCHLILNMTVLLRTRHHAIVTWSSHH